MKYCLKSIALVAALAVACPLSAFAQAGGPDTPSDAAAQGTKENGPSSTGGKGAGKMMKKKHSMKKKKHM